MAALFQQQKQVYTDQKDKEKKHDSPAYSLCKKILLPFTTQLSQGIDKMLTENKHYVLLFQGHSPLISTLSWILTILLTGICIKQESMNLNRTRTRTFVSEPKAPGHAIVAKHQRGQQLLHHNYQPLMKRMYMLPSYGFLSHNSLRI